MARIEFPYTQKVGKEQIFCLSYINISHGDVRSYVVVVFPAGKLYIVTLDLDKMLRCNWFIEPNSQMLYLGIDLGRHFL
jgi:hypothetical protein